MEARCVPIAALVVHVVGLVACGTKIAQTADRRPVPGDDAGVVPRADSGTAIRDDAGDGASGASDSASDGASDGVSDAGDSASDAFGDAPGTQCMMPAQTAVLPSEPQWGGGDTVPSPNVLVSSAYGSGAGPGVYVASSGGFRVYVNGVFIAAGTTPGKAAFVPYTFVPGDNVVAVVATNGAGPPAALVHIDELEQPYVSSIQDWKVSSNPAGDWRSVGYDDTSWLAATDRGTFGMLPGCDPTTGFPSDSAAHWIGAAEPTAGVIALRSHVRVAPVGFGAATTGGGTAAPTLVTTWQDLAAATSGDVPRVILLPDGITDLRPTAGEVRQQVTCPTPCTLDSTMVTYTALSSAATCATATVMLPRNDRNIGIGSNKTIVGLGRGAMLRGASLGINSSQNVILRNLGIYDVNPNMIEAGDGVTIGGGDRIWLDHLTFRWISDGFDDIAANSTNITTSWIHYQGMNELECGSLHLRTAQVTSATVTFHHDWFDTVRGRSPLISGAGAQAHLFNNLWNDNPDYALGSGCTAQVLFEGNYLDNVMTPTVEEPGTGCTVGLIDATAGSNFYVNVGPHNSGVSGGGEPHDSVFTPPYRYTVDPAPGVSTLLRSRAGAGSRWGMMLVRN